ncbi:MAG: TonB-dependent receptor [Casimicrobiaceae bacterium]
MKLNKKHLSLAIARALSAGAVVGLAAPMVYAQTPPPVQKIEKIEVTGSRIPSLNLESESPVSVITAQDIGFTGLVSTSDILNQLPQAFADYGGNLANGATGTASINLRNLGAARTLVLIDNRRVPAGSPTFWPTDINAIPAPLIQRIEVLTGGASAVYGSDAVAGVVNFIMNDHFEGVQFSWNGNGYNHQQHSFVGDIVAGRAATNPAQFQVPGNVSLDGQTQNISMTLGSNFANGKGNATIFFSYQQSDPILQSTRDFSACALDEFGGANSDEWECGGSSTAYPGRFRLTSGGSQYTIANAAGGVRPYNAAADQFNFAPYNYYQRNDTRYNFNAFAHYDALPNVRVYSEFDFMDDFTTAQIAPSGIFYGQPITLSAENPLLSQSFKDAFGLTPGTTQDLFIGRRNQEGGGRQDNLRHTSYRVVIGAKGDILDNKWDYNFWWQSGKVVYQENYQNDFSISRIGRALNVVKDPTTGAPVCASALDGSDPLCVPYDIFHIDGVTQAALSYLQTPGFQSGTTEQSVVGLNLTSDLGQAYGWRLPMAKNGVGVAFGLERRVEKLSLLTDPQFSIPDLAGQGGPTIGLSGQYTVVEPYAEVRVPIMENQPWAHLLSVSGSYRYSDYSTDQTTNSFGLGAEWAPVKEGRLRGSYQQAVRAGNVIELFQAQGLNLFNMSADPCGPTMTATLAQCLRSGLPANLYGFDGLDSPAGQYNFLQGGNPAVKPETAKTYSLGVVLQPLPNLSATIDYWSIKVEDVIGIIPPNLALNQCLQSGVLCDLVHRDQFGSLWLSGGGFVDGLNQNLGSYKTTGIDFTLNWNTPIKNYGSASVSFNATYLDTFITQPLPGGDSYDCAGLYGVTCGTPLPVWRHKLQGIWNTPWNVSAALTWRYFSSVDIDTTSSNPLLVGDTVPITSKLSAQNYIDLALQWNVDKNWSIRGGINNVFDRDPPIASSLIAGPPYGNGNTYPQVYDALGRNMFVNVTAKF